jgi:S-DNA-T family DNA segregation ATPase FtsK/SpoIIIE
VRTARKKASSARSSQRSKTTKARKKKGSKQGLLQRLTAERKRTSGQGFLGTTWLRLLGRVFGWGAFVVPIVLIGIGALLLSRSFKWTLPELEPEGYVGLGVVYVVGLAVLHAVLGASSFEEGLALAAEGQGGGVVGAAILSLLTGAFGGAGATIALLALLIIGASFAFRLSIPELLQAAIERLEDLRERLAAQREPGPAVQTQAEELETRPQPAMLVRQAPVREGWKLPVIEELLELGTEGKADEEIDRKRAKLIEDTLRLFGAPARIIAINRGPTITQFGVEPEHIETRGGRRTKVKVSKVAALADDLALALASPSIRIEAPVPGKGYIGIEVPNTEISLVALRDVITSPKFQKIQSNLGIGLGQDVSGNAIAADLTTMPHLLIAGTTGDPKRVELTYFNGIPHLLVPVVVDLERVVPALQWVSREMDERYKRFSKEGVRNITDFNERMRAIHQDTMPYIVVVIDELADLMMMAPDETERVVTRLAQLARATGIHLVIATQRPSVDVVTGIIKANFPARIAFAVASSVDSRVIIDQPGAERLLGRGDMLFQAPDASAPLRMQGSFVSEGELARLVRFWKNAALGGEDTQPSQAEAIPPGAPLKQTAMWKEITEGEPERDELFNEAVRVLRQTRRGSISLLQRRLRIGYTRAARLIDQLEEAGIVGPAKTGSSAREVLDYGEITPQA